MFEIIYNWLVDFFLNLDYSIVIFIIIFSILLYSFRDRIEFQKIFSYFLYVALLKTKLGIKFMDWIAKKARPLVKLFGYIAIGIGILGGIVIVFALLQNVFMIIIKPSTPSTVAPVLPGINIPGIGILSFWHWVISIFILAVVHEFSHGMVARAHNIKIKSSGLAALGIGVPIIPAAFVEPDEKQLKKQKDIVQHSIFAAGPASNIILAFLLIPIYLIIMVPIANNITTIPAGVYIRPDVENDYPAYLSGMNETTYITEFNDVRINNSDFFLEKINELKPGETIKLSNENESFTINTIEHPKNQSRAYLGIAYQSPSGEKKEDISQSTFDRFLWFNWLFIWLQVLNLGIGLANLLPLGPVDGGRMLQTFLRRVMKNKKKADIIWKKISIITLSILLFLLLKWILSSIGLFN